jgi:hypothetical protein
MSSAPDSLAASDTPGNLLSAAVTYSRSFSGAALVVKGSTKIRLPVAAGAVAAAQQQTKQTVHLVRKARIFTSLSILTSRLPR